MSTLPDACFDMAVFSPPFPSVYAYTDESSDIGNSEGLGTDAPIHFGFFFHQIRRIIKPGRVMMVHCTQIPRMKRVGGLGMFDFRGLLIRLAERSGFVFEYDWLIRKNPQALKHGTPVLMANGAWVPIENIKTGDMVVGSSGTGVKVMDTAAHGTRPMFRVKFSDGQEIDCDGQHLWSVSINKRLSYTLTTNQIIEKGVLNKQGRPWMYIPVAKPTELTPAVLPIDPYTMGVLLGDGTFTSRSSVGLCTDTRVVTGLNLPEGHTARLLEGSERGGDTASYNIIGEGSGNSNLVLDGLRKTGLENVVGHEKFIPSEYLLGSIEQRRSLLAGLLDTDGSCHSKGRIKFNNTSERLIDDVTKLVRSLGGLTHKHVEKRTTYTINGKTGPARDLFELTIRFPVGNPCPFRNSRHADEWYDRKHGCRRNIVSITPVESAECSCIQVDSPDRLYVTDGYVVTHNSQALRTKSRELQFVGLETDRSRSRGAMPDYLLKFVVPGENKVPINSKNEVTRNEWIAWAEAAWMDIRETDTLNTKPAKSDKDCKHICPLQLGVIDRLVRMYSNPGEIVFTPFAGISSEMYQSILRGRRAYGCELKDEYVATAKKNLARAEEKRRSEVSGGLFANASDETNDEPVITSEVA
jgi:hypothetical protein